jgi:hypothetical protein
MAAGNTYTQIASTTLGSAASTISFTSIAATYTDLVLVLVGKRTTGGNNLEVNFNNDSTALYSRTLLYGNGSAAGSTRNTGQTSIKDFYVGLNASNESTHIMNIMNYANTTTFKTMLWRSDRADEAAQAIVGLYRSTSAINRIDLSTSGSTITAGTTASLYGITAA